MKETILLDTGPLVAYLSRRDQHHPWAVRRFELHEPPMLTCEAVLSEACFLLRGIGNGPGNVMRLVTSGAVRVGFRLEEEASSIEGLMSRYANLPISLADACLVRMAERHEPSSIFTLDRDFLVYRKHDRRPIPTIMPGEG